MNMPIAIEKFTEAVRDATKESPMVCESKTFIGFVEAGDGRKAEVSVTVQFDEREWMEA